MKVIDRCSDQQDIFKYVSPKILPALLHLEMSPIKAFTSRKELKAHVSEGVISIIEYTSHQGSKDSDNQGINNRQH